MRILVYFGAKRHRSLDERPPTSEKAHPSTTSSGNTVEDLCPCGLWGLAASHCLMWERPMGGPALWSRGGWQLLHVAGVWCGILHAFGLSPLFDSPSPWACPRCCEIKRPTSQSLREWARETVSCTHRKGLACPWLWDSAGAMAGDFHLVSLLSSNIYGSFLSFC